MSKRMDPLQRRKNILEISKKLFSENGYYETQIHDIITEAGISRGTVYQYFKNKDDLFITLLEEFYKKWESLIKTRIDFSASSPITPHEYLRSRIEQSLKVFADDHYMASIILRSAPGIGRDFEDLIKKLEKKINNFVSDDIRFGIKNKFISASIDVDLASELITGSVFRLAYVYFIKNKGRKNSLSLHDISLKASSILSAGLFNAE